MICLCQLRSSYSEFLEDKVIERVGDNRSVPIDVNIITATNRDLEDLVTGGLIREDLYYRINVIPILVPPLRERLDDLPLLVNFFLRRSSLKGDVRVKGVSRGAMSMIMSYSWPGNVRELRGALEYACVTCRESVIDQHHLPSRICRDENGSNIHPPFNRNRQLDKKSELITVLARAGGNQSEAARLLGVSRVTIWNRMRKFGIK